MNKISEYRKKNKISQKQLAARVGVGPSAIGNYEVGIREVNTQIAWKIVDSLNQLGANCSFDDVFPNPQGNDL